jgi:hypothetical protein
VLLILAAVAVAVFGGGAVAIARLTRQPEGVKRLLEAPRRRIADAEDQTDVRIEGVVEAMEGTMPAPVSGAACVYFEVEVVEGDVGVVVDRKIGGMPFIVRDSSGYAIVDPRGATALLAARPESVLHRRIVGRREKRIVPGDTISVIGRGVREPDPDPGQVGGMYRDGPAMRLRLNTSAVFPLHLLDQLSSGRQ